MKDTRQCRACNKEKPPGSFAINTKSLDGREWVCKSCKAKKCQETSATKRKPPQIVGGFELPFRLDRVYDGPTGEALSTVKIHNAMDPGKDTVQIEL